MIDTYNQTEKKEKMVHKCKIAIALAIFSFVYFISIVQAPNYNPDSDAFWLVSTGKYIWENKAVPTENPWTYDTGLKTVIQQPICALLNYFWYSMSGDITSLYELAILENMVFVLSILYLSSKFTNEKRYMLYTITFVEAIACSIGFLTTRPYQLTMSAMAILIGNLEEARRKKSRRHGFLAVAIVTLWQANYQIASIIAICLFVLCYAMEPAYRFFVKRKKSSIEDVKTYLGLLLTWAMVCLINPSTYKGALYLFNSQKALDLVKDKITETQPPTTNSIVFAFAVITIAVYLFVVKKTKHVDIPELFLVFGSAAASFIAIRNLWMCLIVFAIEVPQVYQFRKRKRQSKEILMSNNGYRLCIFFKNGLYAFSLIMLLLIPNIIQANHYSVKSRLDPLLTAITEIPESAKVYTSFNTGGYFEFLGRKIYIDARPELFYPDITEGEDVLSEWKKAEYTSTSDTKEYVDNADWEYYCVTSSSLISHYFDFTNQGELIYKDMYKDILIYKKTTCQQLGYN